MSHSKRNSKMNKIFTHQDPKFWQFCEIKLCSQHRSVPLWQPHRMPCSVEDFSIYCAKMMTSAFSPPNCRPIHWRISERTNVSEYWIEIRLKSTYIYRYEHTYCKTILKYFQTTKKSNSWWIFFRETLFFIIISIFRPKLGCLNFDPYFLKSSYFHPTPTQK